MTNFKFGDRIRTVGGTEDLTFIGKVGDTVYATSANVGGGADYVGSFRAWAYTGRTWKLAPKPFFEEQKSYKYENGRNAWTVHRVVEMGNGRFAAALSTDGSPALLTEHHFRLMIEVQ